MEVDVKCVSSNAVPLDVTQNSTSGFVQYIFAHEKPFYTNFQHAMQTTEAHKQSANLSISSRMEGYKYPTKQSSKPARFTIHKRPSSEDKTPMEDLTTIIKDQEAKIEDLNLRLIKMEQRIKDIEDALMGVDAIDHSSKVLENEIWSRVDENIRVVRKHQKSADALRKQKNMYRALGINPSTIGL
ncbi:hypothetical protein OCU04_003553 [Sclerotinia nivalis]|uniref:Uncharacterized protein n=1 Tax=Sclerotinia nivalis TaxID=352851 RepID=A0A9X0AT35_9HELO|nr:hypothetical protein OCU04_003553 [Sclerotinia nivalis]